MELLPVEPVRDVVNIRLPRWGRVREVDEIVPWQLVDDADRPVEPVQRYLRELVAQKKSRGTVRSYAYDLQRWWRFLIAIEVEWNKATPADLRDFVLWLLHVQKPSTQRRTASAATAGTVNPITRKQYPGDRYGPATIGHSILVTWNLAAAEIMFARRDHGLRRHVGRHGDAGQVAGVRQA